MTFTLTIIKYINIISHNQVKNYLYHMDIKVINEITRIREVMGVEKSTINENIILEVKNLPEIKSLINENFDDIGSSSNVPIYPEDVSEVFGKINRFYNDKDSSKNYYCAEYKTNIKNGDESKSCKLKFIISVTDHWFRRLHRLEDPNYMEGGKHYNPNIENPSTSDGIDLIEKSIDDIVKIVKNTNETNRWDMLDKGLGKQILILDTSKNYEQLIVIGKRISKTDPFKITLISQIKGARFFRTETLNRYLRIKK